MAEENVTGFSGVPSTYAYLLHRSPLGKYINKLESLRYCSQAGGHMSVQIKKELRRTLPDHTNIFIMYGATEASARLTYLEPDYFDTKMDSIGTPIDGVTLRVMDKQGRVLPDGQTGELVASGDNIMQGYWKNNQATGQALDEYGYHTGDMGYRDSQGFFYVTGRKDDVLKVGGHKINPIEIEDTLMETGLLIEAVVMGVPDELLGNKLIAVMVKKENNCEINDVLSYCAKKLPKHKMPSKVKWIRSLPKKSSGKIDREKCLTLIDR